MSLTSHNTILGFNEIRFLFWSFIWKIEPKPKNQAKTVKI